MPVRREPGLDRTLGSPPRIVESPYVSNLVDYASSDAEGYTAKPLAMPPSRGKLLQYELKHVPT